MHAHLEIVMPPVDDVEAAVKQIMADFDENKDDPDDKSGNEFWDFYVIGGRWSGSKITAGLDEKKLEQFYALLKENKITCSSLQCGKQEISPASQIPLVDRLWNETFPNSATKVCPLFNHFNDQYENSNGFPDIARLKDTNKDLKCSHVIIAGPDYAETGFKAVYMVLDSIWNGVTHQDTKWNGLLSGAISEHMGRLKNYKPEYAAKVTPSNDWLVVTVDYHS